MSLFANSGFRVHAMARATNGIDINPVICKITISCCCAKSGIVINQGNGNDKTNHMPAKIPTISIFCFLLQFIFYSRSALIKFNS